MPKASYQANTTNIGMQVKMTKQLERGVEPHNVNVDVSLTKLKPLHDVWVINYHKDIQSPTSAIKNGFGKRNILEAFTETNVLINLAGHPFCGDNYRTVNF